MNNDNGKIHDTLESVFHLVNNELFTAYNLEFESVARMTSAKEIDIPGPSLMSVLNASGEGVKILSAIKMSDVTAAHIYPGNKSNISREELQDLCGELNNQLVGKVKNKMLAYECKLMLGLPTCITGTNLSSHTPQNSVAVERVYKCDAGRVVVCLHTVVHPAFSMLDEPNNELTGEVVSEGTLDFF